MRSKYVAAVLAFFLGIFGTHRFYLGQRFLGILYFALFFFSLLTIDAPYQNDVPLLALPAILGFIDSILLAVMPQETFDEKYNKKRLIQRDRQPTSQRRPQQLPSSLPASNNRETLNELKRRGIERFRDFDFENAVDDFIKVLEIKPEDPATHFNLACCYSILENTKEAYHHLSQSVKYGFNNFEKIQNHDALAFLRTQPDFDHFVKNNFQIPEKASEPILQKPVATTEETLVLKDDLLDQIIQLGELRNKGILTEEEFAKQKEKILAQR